MPIARFELPDGRIGRFEVPDGTSEDDALSLIQQHLADNPVPDKAARPLPEGVTPSDAGAGRGSVRPHGPTLRERLFDPNVRSTQQPVQRRGGTRSEARPFVATGRDTTAAEVGEAIGGTLAGTAALGMEKGLGVMLDLQNSEGREPEAPPLDNALEEPPAYPPNQQEAIAQQSLRPEVAQRRAREASAPAEARPFSTGQNMAADVREATQNPVARGVAQGLGTIGKVGPGALRIAADFLGSEGMADLAKASGRAADEFSGGVTSDLKGNDKLVAQVTGSIVNSAPSLALGVLGGPALKTLFVQSALSEYNAGRDAGFAPEESLKRAGIMGFAEAIGERAGFPEQIKLLKSLAKHVPTDQLSKVVGQMLAKEIPGEQLTTAMQFMADKAGPAALNPDATLADYLDQAGETLKVTIGQTAVMGGGPAVIGVTRNALRKADAGATSAAPDPAVILASAIDQAANDFGLSPKATAALRDKANTMPAEQAAGFVERALAEFERGNLVRKPGAAAGFKQTLNNLAEKAQAEAEAQPAEPEAAPAPEAAPEQPRFDAGAMLEGDDFSGLDTPAQAGPAMTAPGSSAVEEGSPDAEVEAIDSSSTAAQVGVPASPTEVDQGAHLAATSPTNGLPEPTEAQKKAGNYAKGRTRIGGLDISIENPEGSVRRGVDPDGKPWENQMVAHYGYVRGSRAGDGDHSDIFVKPGTPADYSGPVFVIDQVDPATGKFDEHKTVLGATSEDEARALYEANYAPGWRGLGAITTLPLDAYKSWVRDGVKRKPLGVLDAGSGPGYAEPAGPAGAGPADNGASDRTEPLVQGELQQPVPAGTARAPVPSPAVRDGAGADGPGAGSDALTVGAAVELGGKAYTVKAKSLKVIRLTGEDGKVRVISSDSANWSKIKPATNRQVAPTEEFAGQRGEGMSEFVAKTQRQRLAKERPDLEWTVAEADTARNPKLKADRYVVQGRPLQPQAPAAEAGAQAGGVEPAGPAGEAVAAAGSAQVEADGVKAQPARKSTTGTSTKLTPLADQRLQAPDTRQALEGARADIGWAQRGGQLIRDPRTAIDPNSPEAHREGDVIGRTPWVGSDLWRNRPEQGGKISEDDARQAIDRALAGEPMTARQKRFVQYALDHEAARAWSVDDGPMPELEGLDPQVREATDRLLANAMEVGIDAESLQEDIARQTEGQSDHDFHLALQAALNEALARDGGTVPRADAGAEGAGDQGRGGDHGSRGPPQGEEASAEVERFAAGRALTKEQRKQVLGTLVDVYKAKRAPRELKGLDRNGNERSGYVHSPELFEKSDITGAMVRYYVTLPDGRIAHPSELFPEYTQADIDSELARQQQQAVADLEAKESRSRVLRSRVADTLSGANAIFNRQNPGRRDYIPALLTDGEQFARTAPESAEADAELLGFGWRVQTPGNDGINEARPGLTLTAETPADAQAKASREAEALAAEQKAKDAEQARLKKEADEREVRARADESVDDFQLGQSADQQLSGQGDLLDGDDLAANEPAGAYSAREQDPYQTDLFGQPLPAAAGKPRASRASAGRTQDRPAPGGVPNDTPAPSGEYLTRTIVGVTSQREVGAAKVTDAASAAAATAYLGGSAVERFDGLVTDKDGKPLALIGGFKGALSQTSVYPSTLMGEAVRIPGAANIWLSHNHPSGTPTLSPADLRLSSTLVEVFDGSGIEVRGLLAIGDGKYSFVSHNGLVTANGEDIPAAKGSTTVPAIERQLASRGTTDTLDTPTRAKATAARFYNQSEGPGIILLNSQNQVIGWVPIDGVLTGRLRNTGGLKALYRAASESNAGAIILAHGGELDAKVGERQTIGQNIASALGKLDVRALDIINVKTRTSAAEMGEKIDNGVVLKRGTSAGLPLAAARNTIAALEAQGVRKVNVAATLADMPQARRDAILATDPSGRVRGAFFPGADEVWVIAENLGSERELIDVVLHESFHRGLHVTFGAEGAKLLRQIYATNKSVRVLADKQMERFGLSKEEATNEALADLAMTNQVQNLNGWTRLLRMIQAWLGKIGQALGVELKFTDKRVVDLVAGLTAIGTQPSVNVAPAPDTSKRDRAATISEQVAEGKSFAEATSEVALSRKPNHTPEQKAALGKAGVSGPVSLKGKLQRHYSAAMNLLADRHALAAEAQQGLLDQFTGIKRAVQRDVGNLPVEQDPYVAARLANGGASSVMRALLLHGQAKWAANGQHLEKIDGTKGLLDILAPLGDDLNDWFGWMIGNRAARLMSEGRENNFTPADIKALQSLATPAKKAAFQKAALQYAAFKRSVLDVAQEAGLINAEARKAWDYADYIPFYRQIDEKSTFSPTGRKGLAGQSSGIRSLKGGENALNDPMENLLMNFSRLIDASLKNNALRKTVDTLKAAKSDAVVKVGYDMTSQLIPAEQVKQRLVDAGTPQQILDVIPPEAFDGMAKMWAIQAPSDPDVIRLMVDGKPQFYRVEDPLLLKALTSFVPFDFPGLGMMRWFKRLLTSTVTAAPDFVARNFIRDTVAAQMITRDGFNPGKSLQGVAKSLRESGGFEHMLFAGASFQSGNINAADPTATGRAMRRALRAKGMRGASTDQFLSTVIDTPVKFWEKYRHFSEAIENANREAVFDAATKGGKSLTAASFEARDLMDFNLRGSWAAYQLLADVVPFLNARVQGLYRLGRSDPKRVVVLGLLMTAATLALAWANDGNEEYEGLADWDKDTYWHFWIGGEHFRLPKPFELGVVFATIPERVMRFARGQDGGKKTAGRLWANVRDQLAFDPVPQMIRPGLNVWANKDTFRGTPIEGMADEGKPPHLRYSASTSETTRELLDLTKPVTDPLALSPKKLEYLVNAYTGAAGFYALALSDIAVRAMTDAPPQPEMRADDIPVVKAFYRVNPARGTVWESDLYDMRAAVEEIHRGVKALEREGDLEGATELTEDNLDKLGARKVLDEAGKRLAGINKQRDKIFRDPDMSPAEKRQQLDELLKLKAEIARNAVEHPAVTEAF